MPYLLDADWVIQALAKRSPAVEVVREIGPADLAISWVTVGEIYEGGFGGRNPQAELATLRAFLQPIQALGLDDAVITRFAELRALLRRQGQLIPDFDIIVGATALEHNLTALTFNVRHLSRIPGLQIYKLPSER